MSNNSTEAKLFLSDCINQFEPIFNEGDELILVASENDINFEFTPDAFVDNNMIFIFKAYHFSESWGYPATTGNSQIHKDFHVGISLHGLTNRHSNKIFDVNRFEKKNK